jgi:hypothetical protein
MDITRRILSSVGLASLSSRFKSFSHCSTSRSSTPNATRLPHRGSRRLRMTRSYPLTVGYAFELMDSSRSPSSCSVLMVCHVSKCDTSAEVHRVNVEMLPFDFGPCVAFVRQIFDNANRNLVLDSLAVRLSTGTEEQHPGFTLAAFFPLQPASLIFLRH